MRRYFTALTLKDKWNEYPTWEASYFLLCRWSITSRPERKLNLRLSHASVASQSEATIDSNNSKTVYNGQIVYLEETKESIILYT